MRIDDGRASRKSLRASDIVEREKGERVKML
jgi:hypothetical protein